MRKLVYLLGLLALLTACGESKPQSIKLMTHDSFRISEELLLEFEKDHNITVELLPAGDTGSALNQAILSKKNPLADVFFGVDNTFLSRAIAEDIFIPYESVLLGNIPDELELDPEHRLLPVDYGDVCLNYDIEWFNEHDLAPPENLDSLLDPAYQGLLVVENPASSSPGLAFLLATIAQYGTDLYLDYWADLRANDVLVTDGWEEAYWGYFSAASDGDRPIVVSYASSPPAEVYYSEEPLEQAPTAAVTSPGSCFRQVEFAGILRGTKQRKAAQALIDLLLSKHFQEEIPLQMFMFPANQEAELPQVFIDHATLPAITAQIPAENIDAFREEWIEAWTETVLR
ncbi:MAG: thiamine ABC transporter substrate-binding protein [Chloroflexota bacterium]